MQSPIPTIAQAYGLVSSKNRPTLKDSPEPVQQSPFELETWLFSVTEDTLTGE
jgi:hypothetical protein